MENSRVHLYLYSSDIFGPGSVYFEYVMVLQLYHEKSKTPSSLSCMKITPLNLTYYCSCLSFCCCLLPGWTVATFLQRNMPWVSGTLILVLLVVMLLLRPGLGWKECRIQEEDKWVRSLSSYTVLEAEEFPRRYTCPNSAGSKQAAQYEFHSACTSNPFRPQQIQQCLAGRRVIFIGDSLSTQQGDSLVGMMGWRPKWLLHGSKENAKWAYDPSGKRVPGLNLCWRYPNEKAQAREIGRCYDAYPPTEANEPYNGEIRSKVQVDIAGGIRKLPNGLEDTPVTGTSVHLRMFDRPKGDSEAWLGRVLLDFNGTRPSDVYVVNFGAHYSETNVTRFAQEIGPFVDALHKLSFNATVVWRESSPSHFPGGVNGTYEGFLRMSLPERSQECCTGIPPANFNQNVFVEDYIKSKGWENDIHILRIYAMSLDRGASHRSCRTFPAGEDLNLPSRGREPHRVCLRKGGPLDCRHWSEPGIVSDWNRLMLNHLCN
ncbi:unnamed protein product [Choristocarpus tenellus]